jgi:hypothetical protein
VGVGGCWAIAQSKCIALRRGQARVGWAIVFLELRLWWGGGGGLAGEGRSRQGYCSEGNLIEENEQTQLISGTKKLKVNYFAKIIPEIT